MPLSPLLLLAMPISITCANCQYTFRVRDDFAGKRGKCPQCENVFRAPNEDTPPPPPPVAAQKPLAVGVPVPKPPAARPAAPPASAAPQIESLAGPTSRSATGSRRPAKSATGTFVLWAIISLGGLGAAGGWVFYTLFERQQPNAPQTAQSPGEHQSEAEDELPTEPATDAIARNESSGSVDERRPGSTLAPLPPADDPVAPRPHTPRRSPVLPGAPVASDPVDPMPAEVVTEIAPQPAVDIGPSLAQLVAQCRPFEFMPDTSEQYAKLALLAELVTQVSSPEDANWKLAKTAYEQIAQAKWTPAKIAQLNKFASTQVQAAEVGIVLVGTIAGRGDEATLLTLAPEQSAVLVRKEAQLFEAAAQTQWLIVGRTTVEVVDVESADGPDDSQPVRVIARTRSAEIKTVQPAVPGS